MTRDRLDEIFSLYLEHLDGGGDRKSFYSDHPELEAELRKSPELLVEFETLMRDMTIFDDTRNVEGANALSPGHVVKTTPRNKTFTIERVVGAGAVGIVYKARDDRGQAVALKQLVATRSKARFLQEAEIARRLGDHRNICHVQEAIESDGQHFLVLDYLPTSLDSTLRAGQQARPAGAARIIRDLCEGLQHAHNLGILHRDIKPANVLLDQDGRTLLADFGLGKNIRSISMRTKPDVVPGTARYLAPELLKGQNATAQSDIYAAGATLYELLAGIPPFSGAGSLAELVTAICEQDPPSPSQLNATCPASLASICLKAMAKNPENRYQSAAAFATDLKRFLEGDNDLEARQPKRLPDGVLAAAGVAVIFSLMAVLGTVGWSHFSQRSFMPSSSVSVDNTAVHLAGTTPIFDAADDDAPDEDIERQDIEPATPTPASGPSEPIAEAPQSDSSDESVDYQPVTIKHEINREIEGGRIDGKSEGFQEIVELEGAVLTDYRIDERSRRNLSDLKIDREKHRLVITGRLKRDPFYGAGGAFKATVFATFSKHAG